MTCIIPKTDFAHTLISPYVFILFFQRQLVAITIKINKMKFVLGLIFLLSVQACGSGQGNNTGNPSLKEGVTETSLMGNQPHSVSVLEVIQVANYTYLRVKENDSEIWIAAPSLDTKPGDTLYYENGMLMSQFESKELKRIFDKILFVDKLSKNPAALLPQKDSVVVLPPNHVNITENKQPAPNTGSSKDSVKQSIKVDPVKNGITIADVLKNPKAYEGKTVIIRGKVTKYTAAVMGKNWVHIQDGSDYNGKFEMVITTLAELKDGETATFEGTITLNKDLGYGYFFEVLMENAKVIR